MGLCRCVLRERGVDLRRGVGRVAQEVVCAVLEERVLNKRVDKGRASGARRAWV